MWIRNKVMKFLGIPGYEIQFYKLLNVNVATLRLQTVFLSYIRITTFLELFQLPSSSPSLFLNTLIGIRGIFLQANNRYLEDKLLNFLILDLYGITSLERKIIFFYCTYSVEKYQEEVPIWQSEWFLFSDHRCASVNDSIDSWMIENCDCKQASRALVNWPRWRR